MSVKRMDNVGIVVEDLDAAIEFFTELGLTLEGRAGRVYPLRLRTSRTPGGVTGAELKSNGTGDPELVVAFDGTGDDYVRKEVVVALGRRLLR